LGEFNNNKMANRRSILAASIDPLPASSDPLRELFEACKTGDISRVKKLISPQTVNARDTAGRKSTPLHFAAGECFPFFHCQYFCQV
jgi:tankyrase